MPVKKSVPQSRPAKPITNDQMRFALLRLEGNSIIEAAGKLGISQDVAKHWNRKEEVRAFMTEHQSTVASELALDVANAARALGITPSWVLERHRALADLKPCKEHAFAILTALKAIREMCGFDVTQPAEDDAPRISEDDYVPAWMRERQLQ